MFGAKRVWDQMVDMSIHDVSGVVGWCLGAYSEVENTYVHVTQPVTYSSNTVLVHKTML